MLKTINKYIYYFGLLINLSVPSFSQNWAPLRKGVSYGGVDGMFTDTVSNKLYISGGFSTADSIISPGVTAWNGTSFSNLGCGFEWNCIDTNIRHSYVNPVRAVCMYNGELYAAGSFSRADNKPVQNLAKWNGTTWDSVGRCPDNEVVSLYVTSANELVVAGFFSSIGGIQAMNVAKWNGTAWSGFGSGLPCPKIGGYYANAVCEYKGEIYVGGDIFCLGMNAIAKWNGSSWVRVGTGFSGGFTTVNALCVYNNELIAGGFFTGADGNYTSSIARWDGVTWKDVGGGITGINAEVFQLAVHNNQLYAVGRFTHAGGVRAMSMAKWDGIKWCGFGTPFKSTNTAIGFLNNQMYIGCADSIQGLRVNYIAMWTGGSYVDTCGTLAGIEEHSLYSTFEPKIFPNPNNGQINIQYSLPGSIEGELNLYSYEGKFINKSKLPVGEHVLHFDVDDLPNGVYFCRFSVADKTLKTEKLIIIK
jgi:hypothetical protein